MKLLVYQLGVRGMKISQMKNKEVPYAGSLVGGNGFVQFSNLKERKAHRLPAPRCRCEVRTRVLLRSGNHG